EECFDVGVGPRVAVAVEVGRAAGGAARAGEAGEEGLDVGVGAHGAVAVEVGGGVGRGIDGPGAAALGADAEAPAPGLEREVGDGQAGNSVQPAPHAAVVAEVQAGLGAGVEVRRAGAAVHGDDVHGKIGEARAEFVPRGGLVAAAEQVGPA